MAKTIIIAGYGTGISSAVAERFGREGFTLALAARNAERLQAGVKALEAKGVRAAAFPTDLSKSKDVEALIGNVRERLGPITALHWNAYTGGAGDLLTADLAELRAVLEVPVFSLLTAIRAALPDLRQQPESAVLVTNGGLGLFDPQVDAAAVQWGAQGLAVANAAKHKLVGVLSERLKGDRIYVGEVVIIGLVKGTAWDQGNATLEASSVAERFWQLYRARSESSVIFSG
jgi:short-subunit dehydrogenase